MCFVIITATRFIPFNKSLNPVKPMFSVTVWYMWASQGHLL